VRNRGITGLIGSSAAVLCAACGTPSPPADRSDSLGPDASKEGPSGDAAIVDDATSPDDASIRDDVSQHAGGGDASDGTPPTADAASADAEADGGLQPFKGVANSACTDLARLGVSWWYNWGASRSGCNASQFVPMIWGQSTNIASQIASLASQGFKSVLGFNEPDNSKQSNISVGTAISLWPSFADPSLRIGSPATQGNSTGLTWIQNFMSQVDADTTGKLRVDFIATHWYGWNAGSCDAKAANLESWIKQIEAIPGNRPIWLT